MRITNSMIARNLLENIQKNQKNMNTTRDKISTGKDIQEPSDNPVKYSKSSRFRKTIKQNDEYLNTIASSKSWIDSSSQILGQIQNRLLDAKDIAVQASDLSADNDAARKTMSDQVDNIIQDIVSLGNSTHLDKFLFAGNQTKGNKPFSYNGNTVQYSGNDQAIYRKVADNFNVAINMKGSKLMNSGVFSSLQNLKDGLDNGNMDKINNAIDSISDANNQVSSMNTAMGSLKNQLTATEHRLETTNLNLKSYLSDNEDTDMAEAITDYNAQEMAYEAALKSTSDALNLNILNFLR